MKDTTRAKAGQIERGKNASDRRARASGGAGRVPQRGSLKHGNPGGDLSGIRRCGAHSRRTGKPCRGPAMRNGRCRLHGGLSTGPRTREGLARSRRARWKHGAYSVEADRDYRQQKALCEAFTSVATMRQATLFAEARRWLHAKRRALKRQRRGRTASAGTLAHTPHERRVVDALAQVAFSNMATLFDESGCLKPLAALTADETAIIASIRVTRRGCRTVLKVQLHDALKALQLLIEGLRLVELERNRTNSEAVIRILEEGRTRAAKQFKARQLSRRASSPRGPDRPAPAPSTLHRRRHVPKTGPPANGPASASYLPDGTRRLLTSGHDPLRRWHGQRRNPRHGMRSWWSAPGPAMTKPLP